MNTTQKLIRSLEFENERRVLDFQSDYPTTPVGVRVEMGHLYMLDRLARRYGRTRSAMARELLESAVQDGWSEVFKRNIPNPIPQDIPGGEEAFLEVVDYPTKEEVEKYAESLREDQTAELAKALSEVDR